MSARCNAKIETKISHTEQKNMQKCSNYVDKVLSILSPKPEATVRILKETEMDIYFCGHLMVSCQYLKINSVNIVAFNGLTFKQIVYDLNILN